MQAFLQWMQHQQASVEHRLGQPHPLNHQLKSLTPRTRRQGR